jgi:hypothetical protein
MLRGKNVYGDDKIVEKQILEPFNPLILEPAFPTKLGKNLNILDT